MFLCSGLQPGCSRGNVAGGLIHIIWVLQPRCVFLSSLSRYVNEAELETVRIHGLDGGITGPRLGLLGT